MVPIEVTKATIESELAGIQSYCTRHDWNVTWETDVPRLVFTGKHPGDNSPLCIIAKVDEYRAMPPEWTFRRTPESSNIFPLTPQNEGRNTIFLQNPKVICAHFNRLAYKEYSGPHDNWGGPSNWLNLTDGYVRANKIADMFAVIIGHLKMTAGMSQ